MEWTIKSKKIGLTRCTIDKIDKIVYVLNPGLYHVGV